MQQYFNTGHMSVMDFFPVSNQFTVSWLVIHVFNLDVALHERNVKLPVLIFLFLVGCVLLNLSLPGMINK